MTIPLLILAFLSVCGGALCWPHVLGGHEWLAEVWLRPVTGPLPVPEGDHKALEWALMGASTALAFGGFAIAFVLYASRVHPFTQRFASERPWRWLYLRVHDKWHVDELYDTLIIQPTTWVSRIVFYEGLDRRVIDAFVNLVGWFGRSIGFVGQLFQSGNIQRYLAIFAVGLAVLLYGWMTPTHREAPPPEAEPPQAALMGAGGGR